MRTRALGLLMLSLTWCSPAADGTSDGSSEATAEGGGDGDEAWADGEAGRDAETVGRSGALTLVASGARIETDRVCDLDGDGTLDNAVADLGPGHAEMIAMVFGTAIEGELRNDLHLVAHLPSVDDAERLTDPETTMLLLVALDEDNPPEPSDDFDGDEGYLVHPGSIDSCGEPLYGFSDGALDRGAFTAPGGEFPVPIGSTVFGFQLGLAEGAIDPAGAESEVTLCAYVLTRDLGGASAPELAELSLLEVFLGGGGALGMPAVPGVTPDVDLDGDGLERFVLDDDGRITRCVDGDDAVIEGADCWMDARMADGISLTFVLTMVRARLAGLWPAWPWAHDEPCDADPLPETSWGPCAASPAECDRWATRRCAPPCGGAGEETCTWSCGGWTPCRPDGADRWSLSHPDAVALAGSAQIDAASGGISLVAGQTQVGSAVEPSTFAVGRGPVVVGARVRVGLVDGGQPGIGWAVAALLDDDTPWHTFDPRAVGVNVQRRGYAAAWWFFGDSSGEDGPDLVRLLAPDGSGEFVEEAIVLSGYGGGLARPSLDQSVAGPVEQGLGLIIEPDLPETDENEQLVLVQVASGSSRVHPWKLACRGDGCPTPIRPGDELQVGVAAATSARAASVEIVDLDGDGFSVERRGLCP